MKKVIQLLIIIAFWACSSNYTFIETSGKKVKIPVPPGTIEVDSNFFVDNCEIDVIGYREFIYWKLRIFGANSSEYLNTLPDTNVFDINDIHPEIRKNNRYYLRHPRYDHYPIVGITWEQANDFTKWRSDRTMEYILIKNGLLEPNPNQDFETCFSIEKYYNGEMEGIVPIKGMPYPKFRLPTSEEWKEVRESTFISTQPSYKSLDIEKTVNDSLDYPTTPFYSKGLNKKIYSMFDNVSEMTSIEGIAMGNSWYSIFQNDLSLVKNYTKPTSWLGFRNVCSWEYYK